MRNTARPMPDLRVESGRCESPFWVDDLIAGTRDRAIISRQGSDWKLVIGKESIVFQFKRRLVRIAEISAGPKLTSCAPGPDADALHAAAGRRPIRPRHRRGAVRSGDRSGDRELFRDRASRILGVDCNDVFPDRGGQATRMPPVFDPGRPPPAAQSSGWPEEFAGRANRPGAQAIGSAAKSFMWKCTIKAFPAAVIKDAHGCMAEAMDDCRNRKAGEAALFDRELFYAIQPRERLEMIISEYQK